MLYLGKWENFFMVMIVLVILGCLTIQICIAKFYGILGRNSSFTAIKTLLSDRVYYESNKLLDKILNFYSCIYRRQINEKNREMFFATLAHDLRTPASAQICSLELLLKGRFGKLNDAQKTVLEEMLFSEKYISEIISNILMVSKCDYNKLFLNKTSYDVTVQVNDVCNVLAKLAAERQQTISLVLPKTPIILHADKLQIQRVINNLVSNAIKYGLANSEIKICLDLRNDNFNFTITNKSVYIPKHKISKIFDKFSASSSVCSNSASTGLGLYLSKKIIELHGGRIYAESFLDGTCIFGFYLKPKIFFENKLASNAS